MHKELSVQEKTILEKETPVRKLSKRRLFLSRVKRKILKHVYLMRLVIFFGFIGFLYILYLFTSRIYQTSSLGFYLTLTKDFITTPSEKIENFNGRTNILLLGKGGDGHEAPDLTDTIIFLSVDHQNPTVTLISLPRDIWIPELRAKLNSVYYWGNRKKADGGIILSKATIEEIVGQPVHYAAVLDFSGFKRVVDILEGIEVNVEYAFIDEKYPIPGRENDLCNGDLTYKCRYETVRFEEGLQHMDGETALKFVRSRNAIGDEGTDFARAARQQKVFAAIKSKVLSREILFSLQKLLDLRDAVLESVETDVMPSAAAILARRALQSNKSVNSYVLSEDFLVNPSKSPQYDNLYVFIPKDESWSKIHEWVENILNRTY